MGRSSTAPVQPSIIAPDSNTWRPIVMQADNKGQQSRTRRRSTAGAPAPRDVPIETILNDRLG